LKKGDENFHVFLFLSYSCLLRLVICMKMILFFYYTSNFQEVNKNVFFCLFVAYIIYTFYICRSNPESKSNFLVNLTIKKSKLWLLFDRWLLAKHVNRLVM
jgi:hypothetical protein